MYIHRYRSAADTKRGFSHLETGPHFPGPVTGHDTASAVGRVRRVSKTRGPGRAGSGRVRSGQEVFEPSRGRPCRIRRSSIFFFFFFF